VGEELEHEAAPQPAFIRRFNSTLGFVFCLGALGWCADVYRQLFGLVLYTEQYLAAVLAIGLPLVLVSMPARRGAPRLAVPWYDAILALLAFACAAFMAWTYPTLNEQAAFLPPEGLIPGGILIVLVLESLRRAVGHVLFFLTVFFILYGLVGHLVPGALQGRELSIPQLTYYLAWDTGGMLGIPLAIAASIVVAFIFFGQLLFTSGGSEFFTDISLATMGRFRGGSAKIAVTASALFGSISGSAVANVVATGVVTIPLMRKGGYPAHMAAAIEAVASTGGQLMPPVMGAAAFLMAEFLKVPYSDVVIAALLPSLLYYFGLFVTADLEAAKAGIARIEASRIPALWGVLRSGWHYPIPFAVLILALFKYNRTPEESALASALVLIVFALAFGYRGKRMRLGAIIEAIRETGLASLEILTIAAAAGFIIGVLSKSGVGFGLTLVLVDIGHGNVVLLLLLAALTSIVLGCGMPTAAVYVLLAALVAPALVEVGLKPMAAHMFVLFFGMMSMITPPVAIAAYAAASLAGADPIKTGLAAVRFGWTAFVVPFLFVAAPSLLLDGPLPQVAWAVITAVAGVWLACVGAVGYLRRPLGWLVRLGAIVAGVLMLIPAGAFPGAIVTDYAGIALAIVVVGYEWMRGRAAATPAPLEAGPGA
jgi:TRAP transporter 4TM/12TM fusion protein